MTLYSVESRTRQYVKGYGYLSLAGNLSKKYEKQLLDTASKTRINASKDKEVVVPLKCLSNFWSSICL